jgi:Domain of unknown function DUF11
VLTFVGTAKAATISVTTTGDPGPAGTTSLRQAIAEAASGDTVSVPAGHYTLAMGQLTVSEPISIVGVGAATIIDGNHASRVFNVTSAGTVAINDLTIENGTVNAGSTTNAGGAGVMASGDILTLTSDTLSSNTVTGGGGSATGQGGGAVYNHGNSVRITSSTLTGNGVTLNGSASNNGGGAIFSDGDTVTIVGSVLQGNFVTLGPTGTTSNDGGGAAYDDGAGFTISGSQLTGNSVSVTDGTSNDGGGAYYDNGAGLTLGSSDVSGNRLTISGGTTNDGGGGIYNNGGLLGITATTLASNTATLTGTTGVNGGGGVYNNGASTTLVNVTLSDNALSLPSGSDVGGGGYYGNSLGDEFTNVTVTANQSNQAGGGIYDDSISMTLKGTIVAANGASTGNANCAGNTPTSDGNNLEDTSPTTCGFTQSTDIVGKSAGLGPLANNGGPGPTHALLAGSPAIDHIPVAQCTDQETTPKPVATDERGVARGLDGFCDVGAYEYAPASLTLSASAAPSSIIVSQSSTATFTVTNAGPAPSTGTALNLSLPAGLKLVSAIPSQGSCTGTTCSVGLLQTGATAHVTATVTGVKAGAQSIVGAATENEVNPTSSGATKSLTITVGRPALSKLKVKPGAFKVRAQVSYRLNVAARVRFVVERCTRSKNKPHRLKCKKRFSFNLNGKAGANHFTVKLKLHGHKLTRGSYKFVATPTVDGVKGSSKTVSFDVAAPAPRSSHRHS